MMKHSSLKRSLALCTTAAVFGLVAFLIKSGTGTSDRSDEALAAAAKDDAKQLWALFGVTPQRNMLNTVDTNVPSEWHAAWKETSNGKVLDTAQSKHIKWVAKLGSRAYGGPIVSGGKVYVGTNNESPRNPKIKGDKGVLMCFAESDGKFLWQGIHDKLPSGQVHDWPKEGLCSTPIVEGNRVYYVNNRCEVICADTDGDPETKGEKVLWKLEMMKDLNVFPHNMSACSPVIVGELLFVVTANGVDEDHINIPSPEAPSFIAINKKTGKVVWKDASPGKLIMHGQWSNPVYAVVNGKGQIIFPGGDGWLRAFNPETGKQIWMFDANPKDSKYELGGKGTRSDFIATPVIVGNQMFIGTGQDPEHYEGIGHLWCVDITKTGDISPELSLDGKVPSTKSKPNPNSGVVWHYGGPVKKEDAAKVNRDYYFGRTMSTVAVQDGLVYAGELAGYLHCLDAKTGKPYWVHDLKAAVWGSAYWVDGKVFIATEDGDVWIFKHGKDKAEPKKIEMEQPIRSTPIVVNGVLYVMTESHLYAIANK
jgi:outer membrane protein assembly factor BamB